MFHFRNRNHSLITAINKVLMRMGDRLLLDTIPTRLNRTSIPVIKRTSRLIRRDHPRITLPPYLPCPGMFPGRKFNNRSRMLNCHNLRSHRTFRTSSSLYNNRNRHSLNMAVVYSLRRPRSNIIPHHLALSRLRNTPTPRRRQRKHQHKRPVRQHLYSS